MSFGFPALYRPLTATTMSFTNCSQISVQGHNTINHVQGIQFNECKITTQTVNLDGRTAIDHSEHDEVPNGNPI